MIKVYKIIYIFRYLDDVSPTDLSQKRFFSTIRAATNINLECVAELVEHFKTLKQP